MERFIDGFEKCLDVKIDDFKIDYELNQLINNEKRTNKPFQAMFAKKNRHYKIMSSIPEDAKMYITLLTYENKPTKEEFKKHIRKLMKKLEKEDIISCPFFEYQVNRDYFPHWHILMNKYIGFRLTKYWKNITRSKKVTAITRKVTDERIKKVINLKHEDYSAVSAVIEYCLKVRNKDKEWVKLAPDNPRYIKYSFRNTYIKKFVDFYKPCDILINFLADGCNDKVCELVLTRQDIKFDLNNESNYYEFFRVLFFDIISYYEEKQNSLINEHCVTKIHRIFNKFFLKRGILHIQRLLSTIHPYSLILEIKNEAQKRKSQLVNVYFNNEEIKNIEFL